MTDTFQISERELGGLSSIKEVEHHASNRYRATQPEPQIDAQVADTSAALEKAKSGQNAAQDKLDDIKPYLTRYEVDTSLKPDFLDKAMCWLACCIGLMLICVIPAISTMLIVEAGDIALVADSPIFGFAFGIAAVAGAIASAQYRDSVGSEAARARYDRRLIRWTQVCMVAWVSVAAFSAYPIGGEATSDIWSLDSNTTPAEKPFEMPRAFLFIVTALLDMSAAAVVHHTARKHLILGYLISTSPNPRYEAQAEYLKQWQVRTDQLSAKLDDLKEKKAAWAAGEAACVEDAVSRYHALHAHAKAAAANAHAQVLRGDGPATPSNINPFTPSTDPDGQGK